MLFGVVITSLPFLLTESYDVSPVFVGLVITVTEAASAVVALGNGRLATRFSDTDLIVLGFACYGVGLLGAWVTSSLAVVTAGVGLTMPSVDALLSGLVRQESGLARSASETA